MKQMGWKNRIQEYMREHRLRKRWYKLTAVLAAAAVVVTGTAMILPAVTMENSPQMLECQLDIHTHSDSCYDENGNVTCGYADFVVHTHDSACYAEDGTLICPLEEIEAHTHDASCYQETRILTCGLEEGVGHIHDDSCYGAAEEPACGLEESAVHVHEGHIHTEACYEVSETLICGQEEAEPHTHDADCYDAEGNLICQKSEAGHTHTAECYETQRTLVCTQDTGCYDEDGVLVCGQSEGGHTHTAECYPEEIICGQEETAAHTHTDDCYEIQEELICGKEEIILHTHTEACFDENGGLICGMPEVKEHIHDESCIPQKESGDGEPETAEVIPSGTSGATVSKPGYTSTDQPVPNAMLFAAPQAETGSYDFADDITSVTVERQQGGQWTQSDTFTDGDTIRVTIRYTIPAGIINGDQRSMHYQLPAGIALEETETGSVYLEGGDAAGTYTISTDGLISITFDEEFANGEAFSGNFYFQGSIALADLDEGEEITFGGAGGVITVVPEEKQHSLIIAKAGVYVRDEDEAAEYDKLNMGIEIQPEHLIYTIEVRADETSDGSDGTITVTDAFTHNPADGVATYDKDNITVLKITPTVDGASSAVKITDYELNISQQTGTDDAHTGSFTITGLPALQPGERYSINYSASIDFETVNTTNGYISVPNEATAKDNSQTVTANASVGVSRRMVHKEVSANEGTGNVQWTITLNEDGRDLSGRIFRDEMIYAIGGGEIVSYPLKDITNLRVTAYALNDVGQQVSQGDVTAAFQKLITYENHVMTVRFPAADAWPEGLGADWVYEIVYETPFPEGAEIGAQIAFQNTARLDGYYVTANWNGEIPEAGYGLVKRNTGSDLNTGTDLGTIDWESTISYPSTGFELNKLQYMDWIPDACYEESGTFIPDSHYTTPKTLRDTLHIQNAAGQELVWGEDFIVSVVYSEDMPNYDTFQNAWDNMAAIFRQELIKLTDQADPNQAIGMFCVTFTEQARAKLEGGQRLYISYRTFLDRQGVTDGRQVKIYNVGSIMGSTVQVYLNAAFHPQLRKQVSNTGMPPSGDDFNLDSDVYVDGPVDLDLGDTGGRLYYRILFYNYDDVIEFHDDLLQKFDGKVSFDQNMRIYDAATGELIGTAKIWGQHINNDGKYYGNYKLYDLDEFQNCIIGLYYSIDVSADPALADLAEGENLTYTNTVKWTGVDTDSATANVTDSELTLKKDSVLITENGENLICYYVTVNPEGRDLHPGSDELELRDNLTLPAGASATLRPETIGLYHYDAQNQDGYYLGAEVTEEEFGGFQVVQTEGTANSYTFTVPDGMACVIVYVYEIDAGTSALEELQVSNTASLLGRAIISAGDNITIQAQQSGGQVNKATLTIYKIGGNDVTNLLQGVLFDLFRYEQQEDGTYAWARTDLTAKGPVADDGGRHFITGGDGLEGAIILNFLDEEGDGNSSYYNTLYRLTEYETLDGYELDTTPRYYVWGELGKTEEQTAAEMADVLAEANVTWDEVTFIPFGQSKTETISNEPLTTSITVTKQWLNMNGEESPAEELPESITVTLYRHVGETKTQYGDSVTVRPDENGEWSYTWERLPRKDETGAYCTYSVEETDIDGYETSYRYPEDGSAVTGIDQGEIQITNTKIISFVLPETGGLGTAPYIIAGLLLVGMSGVGYRFIRRKRRRGGRAR